MQYTKLFSLFLAASIVMPIAARKIKDKREYGVYLAGVSASFTDSLVYFTEIQYLDSASLNKAMLEGRVQYSTQLIEYLGEKLNKTNRTCFIFFSKKKNKLQKEIAKVKQRHQKGGKLILKELGTDFKFEKADLYE